MGFEIVPTNEGLMGMKKEGYTWLHWEQWNNFSLPPEGRRDACEGGGETVLGPPLNSIQLFLRSYFALLLQRLPVAL